MGGMIYCVVCGRRIEPTEVHYRSRHDSVVRACSEDHAGMYEPLQPRDGVQPWVRVTPEGAAA